MRLHLSNSIPHPANINAPPQPDSCVPSPASDGFWKDGLVHISNYFSPYDLRFPHVQLALKQHRHGPNHGISLSQLSHTDIQLTGGDVFLFSADARIASNELVMRSQEWVVMRQHPREALLSGTLDYGVCQHLMFDNVDLGFDPGFTDLIRCRLSHGEADDFCDCMDLHQCASCPMEFQFDFVDLNERGTAFCATKWLNLGDDLVAMDSKWYRHNFIPGECNAHHLPFGSIRESFESQDGVGVEEFTAENKRRLVSSLRVTRDGVCLDVDKSKWRLAANNIWYFGPLGELDDFASLLHRMLAWVSRTILRFLEAVFG